ncbi:MAG: hypothetical protein ABIH68_06145 [bacterium]
MADILLLKLKIFLNSVRHPERPLKKLLFSFLGIIFLAGIYFWLKRIFIYITNVPLIGEAVLVRFLSLMIFISGGVAVLSSLLSAISTMYTTEEMKLLISFPFSGSALFGAKVLETALYANWMIFVVAVPFALAWNSIYSMNFFQVVFSAAAFFVFLMTMSFLGVSLASVFALAFPSRKIRDGSLVFFAVAFGGIFFYLKALEPKFIFHADASENFFQYLSRLRMPGTLLEPFQWVSRLFIAVSQKNYGDAFTVFGILLIIFLVSGAVCFAFGSGYFIRTAGKIRASGSSGGIYKSNVPALTASALKWREKTLFLRNSEQLSQVVILVVLTAIYLFSIYKAPLGDLPRVRELLTFLNIGGVGLILTASALRFVFTGVGLDGRFLWLLFSAPLDGGEILKGKMAVFTKPMIFAGIILGVLSGCCFRADFFVIILTSAVTALIGFVVAQMAFYFAVSYPSYGTDNISQMESSYGGLVFMITGIFYVVSVLAVLAYPAHWYLMGKIFNTEFPVRLTALFLFLFLLDSFIFSFFPGLWALRIFKSREHRNLVAKRQ